MKTGKINLKRLIIVSIPAFGCMLLSTRVTFESFNDNIFSLFLGFTFVRGSPGKGLTIVEEVEKKNLVCWRVTLSLDGNPMFSRSWCWFRTLQ